MGALQAADRAPFLVFGLLAGVWVDRRRRRPVMVWAAALEAALLLTIPAAFLLHVLSLVQLIAVGFLAGTANLAFDVAGMALLPAIVERSQLVSGNSRIQATDAAAGTVGPPVAGALVQALTAPIAIAVDGVATVLKAALLAWIPADPPPTGERAGVWQELREGLELVFGTRVLRSIAGCTATSNLFASGSFALLVLFAVRELRLTPAEIGLAFAGAGPASLVAALTAGRLATWIGRRGAIAAGAAGFTLAGLLVPWLPPVPALDVGVLMLAGALGAGGGVIYNVNQVSLRQAITPDRLQGRMGATMRFLVWGVMPIGSLAGGLLGQAFGLRTALWICALGAPLALLWLLALRREDVSA